jgi:hypothetical protein
MRAVAALLWLVCEITWARQNCPKDLKEELPFAIPKVLAVEQWTHQKATVQGKPIELAALITSHPTHFQPGCQNLLSASSTDQARHIRIWARNHKDWEEIGKTDDHLVPWDHVGSFDTRMTWNERTLIINEQGYATRLIMEYTTRIRISADTQVAQIVGQDARNLYDEYRISSKEAQIEFDDLEKKNPKISNQSGSDTSINWLTGQASVRCYKFAEVPSSTVHKFDQRLLSLLSNNKSQKKRREVLDSLACK